MSNDVLIAIPLFVFMGYLVERADLIDQLFKSLHLATGARAGLARRGHASSPARSSPPPPASSARSSR